jgi:phosphoglycolate phosphatase
MVSGAPYYNAGQRDQVFAATAQKIMQYRSGLNRIQFKIGGGQLWERRANLKYRAVLFDLDGTLLDTLEDLAGAVNKGLGNMGLPLHEIQSYKYFISSGREEMVTRALPPQSRDSATVKRLVDFVNQEYTLHWCDHTRPYSGVTELLDSLTIRKIRMTILSNKPHNFTEAMVARLLSCWHFEAVVGALPGVPIKPDCTAAIKIARELNIAPSQFLYLGDSDIDMQTAVNAGMYPVGATWGFRTGEEIKAGGAATLIDRPDELLRFFT